MNTRLAAGAGLLGMSAIVTGAQAQVPDTVVMAPIVVTATRAPLPARRLGARVTVLTAADLRAAGVATVGEVLEGLPGLAVARTAGPGSATSLFVRGGESDYVKVLVDGVPVNDPGGAYDFANLTVDNVERIEIVRGPTSVVAGSDAVSGVVHVITRRDGSRAGAGVRGGTYGTVETEVDVAGGSAAASYALAGAWRRSDGLYDLNSGSENTTFGGRVHVAPAGGTVLDLSVRATAAEYRYPTDGAGNVVDANQRQQTRTTTLGLGLEQRLHARLLAHVALRSHTIAGGLDDEPDDAADTTGFYAFRSQRDVARQQAEAWLDWTAWGALRLTGGASYELQRERSSGESRSEFGPFTSSTNVRRHNWAGYVEAGWLGRRGTLTTGARVDRNERFGTFVTWRAMGSVTVKGGLRAFGSAGTAFKEPTFFEQYGGAFVVGSPDLAPERTLSWEGGLEQTGWSGRARIAVSYFGQRFRDLIQYTAAPPTPDGANYLNVAAADADGVELEASLQPFTGVVVDGSYTYLRTRVTDGGVLPADDAAFRVGATLLRRPTHAFAARARWDGGIAGASAAVRWTGVRADADFSGFPATRVELPAYAVVDVGATLRPFRRIGAALEAQLRNVFDVTYQHAFGFPAPGRMVLLGVRLGIE